jgi:hypothetical protein
MVCPARASFVWQAREQGAREQDGVALHNDARCLDVDLADASQDQRR